MRPLEMVERMAARMPISISMMASIVAANSFFSICLARLANSERDRYGQQVEDIMWAKCKSMKVALSLSSSISIDHRLSPLDGSLALAL